MLCFVLKIDFVTNFGTGLNLLLIMNQSLVVLTALRPINLKEKYHARTNGFTSGAFRRHEKKLF
jgi:hypothetical protein